MIGNRELIPVLDKYGVLIDATDAKGDTVLHIAVHKNDLKTIEVLLQIGADVNSTDNHLKTPMHYVVHGEWDILDILAKQGPTWRPKILIDNYLIFNRLLLTSKNNIQFVWWCYLLPYFNQNHVTAPFSSSPLLD
eukprot:TRINITY_DN11884_c0_g1_i4.p1 TRINITY_DN11884_c0_g1~~TRINITY_DN11884_c0_g1_i4.p1  ORF type:complete len:135 (-),score=27.58 TRINITY_DN11884_c0_g1_i4:49-453(-)